MTAGDAELLYLTTTGRRSGRPREIEIWFTRHEGCYYLVAEHGDRAHWVQNLSTDPRVQVRVADSRFSGTARALDPNAEPALCRQIQALSEKKYGWGDGLVVEITPAREGDSESALPGAERRSRRGPRRPPPKIWS